jgi:sensor domain CHASE-containing protein
LEEHEFEHMILSSIKQYRPILIAIVVFGFLAYAVVQYLNFEKQLKNQDIRGEIFDNLIFKKSKLEKALSSRIYYTKGIAAFVSINPDITEPEFQELTKKLIGKDSVIHTMSLAKDCIIGAMYPREGNEAAIGLDLLDHKARREIVEETIQTKNTFVAGPVELMEGGIAFISYTPIFVPVNIDSQQFWGVTDIVIKRDQLINEAGIKTEE